MADQRGRESRRIPALRVPQWLKSWNDIGWSKKNHQDKPPLSFFVFSLAAAELKALTGVYRRSTSNMKARADDLAVQRGHETERSDRIREFVKYGFPWCEISETKRKSGQFKDLRKPGWLPTAIVVNILTRDDPRGIIVDDLVLVTESSTSIVELTLPKGFKDSSWRAKSIPPLEVIDGQHRLWAFEDFEVDGTYELPVVAFHGLDRSWQAYLFWSINVTPKRINPSLAFDLYPLLRTEEWLERFHGHSIYRETRSQEIVEALWSNPVSPWYQRINMLGEKGQDVPMVSQAAWIRSLMAACLKQWEGRGTTIGGLFGAPAGNDKPTLPWSRAQQAAFLIGAGILLRDAVKAYKGKWAQILRQESKAESKKDMDPAFYGEHSLLSTDQGIRGILFTFNDLCYVNANSLALDTWNDRKESAATNTDRVSEALASLRKQDVWTYMQEIALSLASYDWRTSSAPGLTDGQSQLKAAFRGSSGYRLLREKLLEHVSAGASKKVGDAANIVLMALKNK